MRSSKNTALISIIIPAYNEVTNIKAAYDAVRDVFKNMHDRYEFEVIFTDNHSTDGSFKIIERLAAEDPRVRGVRFSRNFGFHRSVLTGFRMARGDAAIQLDCDLQDPPQLFPTFLELWEKGHDVVVGIRRRRDEPRMLHWARRMFYRILSRISDDNLVIDGGDFRLLDRTILDQLRWIDDAAPYTRGLTSSLAANQTGVPYDRKTRLSGKSKYPLRNLFNLALDGFLAHSTVPLRFAAYTGLIVAVITFALSLIYVSARLVFGVDWPTGFATTTALLLFGISLNAIFLGIIGEYVGRIYNQVRQRPTTVVERSVNLAPALGDEVASETIPTVYTRADPQSHHRHKYSQ